MIRKNAAAVHKNRRNYTQQKNVSEKVVAAAAGETEQKKMHRMSEIIASLGIMGTELRAPVTLLEHHSTFTSGKFKGGPQLGPHHAERRQSL